MALGTLTERLAELAEAYDRRGDDFAWCELRRFGEALEVIGGAPFMSRIYDATVERQGYASCLAVADVWEGIGQWHK